MEAFESRADWFSLSLAKAEICTHASFCSLYIAVCLSIKE